MVALAVVEAAVAAGRVGALVEVRAGVRVAVVAKAERVAREVAPRAEAKEVREEARREGARAAEAVERVAITETTEITTAIIP